ncbi:MAG: O-methyltransferase [Acidobacteria bacterium]|nr:O-methyltransferase [Acidobacteriota bacterium]
MTKSDFLFPELRAYLDSLVPPRHAELQGMEAEAARTNFPIIGPAAGQFCYFLARLAGVRSVFELGSGFGYSTAWFARAVRENGGGVVHHVVWDADLSARARTHLAVLGLDNVVQFHVGEAVAALRDASGPFDLIFNDIEKKDYPASLPVIAARLRPGGLLIVDNVLWRGRVLDGADRSAHTEGVREVTRLVTTDPAWTATLVPIRDGLLVAQRAADKRAAVD